ncbi:dTDP-4-dehydrorhamnose reductase [Stenotrophomonas panacihumi]|uniref:dTDP-4-dehydrorhamnose reductase n=1 Tax=Stenotrophomonas panacihumi TaxID=676599 RepID=A0A0R0AFC4_9GAMM|nr:dTDP-4-dehydrorhamnose reductase [Stenotrophomonas panacihumi]KRG43597.1 dTDP-4-dehydrorhamnose reductase [Stenotrophomonas panacihumi]PTN55343.1 dTDP-4-dehydrorhamnose reductase [Stenotrophomonas panacihumi]
MTTLVLGANGQVGQELMRALAPLAPVVGATRSGRLADGSACETADFTEPTTLPALLDRLRPHRVINAAAYTAVDRAEQERELAFCVNGEAPGVLAQWCAAHDVPLVHYSTDYVFDGEGRRPYRPEDPTAPLGVYGASKLAGEQRIQAAGGRHLIFRTAWVYAAHSRNFLLTMLKLAAEREELRVVADQTGTPTSATLVANVTRDILVGDQLMTGVWHLTATGQTSWHGFAESLLGHAHGMGLLERMPRVVPVTTDAYPTPARRPRYSCLDCSSLVADFPVELPDWRREMEAVLGQVARLAVEGRLPR